MNPELSSWDVSKHQYDNKRGFRLPEAPQAPQAPQAPCHSSYAFGEPFPELADELGQLELVKVSKTRTSPISTRSRITRHGSQPTPLRPTSSGGDGAKMVAHRAFAPPSRSQSYSHPTPLDDFRKARKWPPSGYRHDEALDLREAEELICSGASTFKGYWDVAQRPSDHDRFYALMESEDPSRTDRASVQQQAYRDVSLNMTGSPTSQSPWLSQEQPCMAYAFGKSPGTTTLNYCVGKLRSSTPPVDFDDSVKPRKIKLLQILHRLQVLESGLDEDDPEEMYEYLYSTLIEGPRRYDEHRHIDIDEQISDLIRVLSNTQWIDFSLPKNQVIAKFFDAQEQHKKQEFFHQLLLSVELFHRIHTRSHSDKYKRKLISQLSPAITWDLAVAQRWLANMEITKTRYSSTASTFSFDLKSKTRQIDALQLFARVLKWPNMDEVQYVLEERDKKEKALEDRSADAMSWFSGVILPGKTLPWLIMNSLIDCDRDTGDALKFLTHMQPASGFQYRANTYWSSQCIVGKVLGAARGVKQIAGWIGPCIFTPDLKRTECVKVKQRESLDPKLVGRDVESMSERTHPLGPEASNYPIDDYEVPIPDAVDVTDLIRMEKLSFVPAKDQPSASKIPGAPMLFDAAVYFACGGESWPMNLRYDVDFVSAFPCHQGPHLLFYDFDYKAIKIDDGLVDIHDWGRKSGRTSRPSSSRSSPGKKSLLPANSNAKMAHEQVTKVLAIEALGVSDNEVFARAWCAHHGHNAIIANIKETCMACAIREAYAACISVVILTAGGTERENDTGIREYV